MAKSRKSCPHKPFQVLRHKANSASRSRHLLPKDSLVQLRPSLPSLGPRCLQSTRLEVAVSAQLLPGALSSGVNAPRHCFEPPHHSKHFVLLQFWCNGQLQSFLFNNPVISADVWSKEMVWSFPMQWDKISSTVAALYMYFLKMPCACKAGTCPLFHSSCIWKAFINIWSKLILLSVTSGSSKTYSDYFSFSSKLSFICLKPLFLSDL